MATTHPERQTSFLIPDLNDALLFLELEGGGTDRTLGVWLSTYGLSEAEVMDLRTAIPKLEGRLAP